VPTCGVCGAKLWVGQLRDRTRTADGGLDVATLDEQRSTSQNPRWGINHSHVVDILLFCEDFTQPGQQIITIDAKIQIWSFFTTQAMGDIIKSLSRAGGGIDFQN
jgi:hypothetical protein